MCFYVLVTMRKSLHMNNSVLAVQNWQDILTLIILMLGLQFRHSVFSKRQSILSTNLINPDAQDKNILTLLTVKKTLSVYYPVIPLILKVVNIYRAGHSSTKTATICCNSNKQASLHEEDVRKVRKSYFTYLAFIGSTASDGTAKHAPLLVQC